ncbi:MarR family transcriptional regulator [Candidatus Bathyarchaeota archaeon]|nr:MarR family transcriptional regulator [Candidatus Bathyarchaeota archaeon]
MSEKQNYKKKNLSENLLKIKRAPSQFLILLYLIDTGKTMSVKELATELNITPKATERAVSKLLEKDLIQRHPFRDGGYNCDLKLIVLNLLLAIIDLYDEYEKRNPNLKTQVSPLIEEEPRPQSTLLPE